MFFFSLECVWSDWEEGECSKSCGGGVQIFKRKIIREPLDGSKCQGETVKIKVCGKEECPQLECVWSEWSEGECSKTCGDGVQIFRRRLTNETLAGAMCGGETMKTEVCRREECLAHSHYYVAIIVLLVLLLVFSTVAFLYKMKIITFPSCRRKPQSQDVNLFTF